MAGSPCRQRPADRGEDRGRRNAEADIFRQAMIDEWWSSAQPIAGTPAETYLNSRGLNPGADDLEQLRWLPDFRGAEGAMLAAIRDNEGELVGLQMTFITPSGQKSSVSPVRRTLQGAARLECPRRRRPVRCADREIRIHLRGRRGRPVGARSRPWPGHCDPRDQSPWPHRTAGQRRGGGLRQG